MQELLSKITQLKAIIRNQQLPYIIQSFAMSLDGKIATYTGDSKYISGAASQQLVHQLRNLSDGILVGINTVQIDHPKLTTRLTHQLGKDAHRIILDTHGKIAIDEPLILQKSSAKTIVCFAEMDENKHNELLNRGVVLLKCQTTNGHIDVIDACSKLYSLGIKTLLVEGGSDIHFSFLEAALIDYTVITVAPLLIGGKNAKTAVGGQGFPILKDAVKLTSMDTFMCGSDLIIHGPIDRASTTSK